MTESELAKLLAKRMNTTSGEAADRLDRVVHQILRRLRSGAPATMPGLGKLIPGPDRKPAKPAPRKRS